MVVFPKPTEGMNISLCFSLLFCTVLPSVSKHLQPMVDVCIKISSLLRIRLTAESSKCGEN